ncbi:hypothetical protein LXL04_024337 [Taraxacum kok-saghyz]
MKARAGDGEIEAAREKLVRFSNGKSDVTTTATTSTSPAVGRDFTTMAGTLESATPTASLYLNTPPPSATQNPGPLMAYFPRFDYNSGGFLEGARRIRDFGLESKSVREVQICFHEEPFVHPLSAPPCRSIVKTFLRG